MFSHRSAVFRLKQVHELPKIRELFSRRQVIVSQHYAEDNEQCGWPGQHFHALFEYITRIGFENDKIVKEIKKQCLYFTSKDCNVPFDFEYFILEHKCKMTREFEYISQPTKLFDFCRISASILKDPLDHNILETPPKTFLKSSIHADNLVSILHLCKNFESNSSDYLTRNESAIFVRNWCTAQNIDIGNFVNNWINCLDKELKKRNTLYFQEDNNSCIKFIVQSITEACNSHIVYHETTGSKYFWKGCFEKRMVALFEPHLDGVNSSDIMYEIFEGTACNVNFLKATYVKFYRTPVVIVAREWVSDRKLKFNVKNRCVRLYENLKRLHPPPKKLHPAWLHILAEKYRKLQSRSNVSTYNNSENCSPGAMMVHLTIQKSTENCSPGAMLVRLNNSEKYRRLQSEGNDGTSYNSKKYRRLQSGSNDGTPNNSEKYRRLQSGSNVSTSNNSEKYQRLQSGSNGSTSNNSDKYRRLQSEGNDGTSNNSKKYQRLQSGSNGSTSNNSEKYRKLQSGSNVSTSNNSDKCQKLQSGSNDSTFNDVEEYRKLQSGSNVSTSNNSEKYSKLQSGSNDSISNNSEKYRKLQSGSNVSTSNTSEEYRKLQSGRNVSTSNNSESLHYQNENSSEMSDYIGPDLVIDTLVEDPTTLPSFEKFRDAVPGCSGASHVQAKSCPMNYSKAKPGYCNIGHTEPTEAIQKTAHGTRKNISVVPGCTEKKRQLANRDIKDEMQERKKGKYEYIARMGTTPTSVKGPRKRQKVEVPNGRQAFGSEVRASHTGINGAKKRPSDMTTVKKKIWDIWRRHYEAHQ